MGQEPVEYDARNIQVLEGREAIRKRPGMYIGSTGERGLHNLVYQVADRAVNEVLAGRASRVDVALIPDGGVRVADDGPGVRFEDAEDGRVGLEGQLTRMLFGVSAGAPRYPLLGFCGVGLLIVNALSSRLLAEVRHDGVRRSQEYERGVAATAPTDAGPAAGAGTVITFWPDAEIFKTTQCSFDVLAQRFQELAFLNQDLDISLADERRPSEPRPVRFRFPGGVRDMVAFLDKQAAAPADHEIIGFEREDPHMSGTMEVAWRWHGSAHRCMRSFANSRPTPDGGTHVVGFRDGVVAAVSAYAREQQLLTATAPDFDANRIDEGLTAVVSVKLEHPEFEGSTRGRLGNAPVRACVRQAVQEHLASWLRAHPQQAAAIIDRLTQEPRRD